MSAKVVKAINYMLFSILIFMASNFWVIKEAIGFYPIFLALYVVINIFPVIKLPETKRLRACATGNGLLIEFLGSTGLSVILFALSFTRLLPIENIFGDTKTWIVNCLFAILLETTVFWNGIVRIFLFSEQLDMKIRVKALICGLIPIAHLIVLGQIIRIVDREVEAENEKIHPTQMGL